MRFGVLLALSACAPEQVSLGAYVREELDAQPPMIMDAQLPVLDANLVDANVSDASAPSPYFEAEDGMLSGGFSAVNAAGASNGAALSPPAGTFDSQPGSARAQYRFSVASAGSYVIWGRIRSPGASNNRFWFQVDDGPWTKWRISTGEIWYWDDLHDDANYGNALHFTLAAGEHRLTVANCVEGVLLDRFYVTSAGDKPPGNETRCVPPHSIELNGGCVASCGAQSGHRCGMAACAGMPLISAYDCDICCEGT